MSPREKRGRRLLPITLSSVPMSTPMVCHGPIPCTHFPCHSSPLCPVCGMACGSGPYMMVMRDDDDDVHFLHLLLLLFRSKPLSTTLYSAFPPNLCSLHGAAPLLYLFHSHSSLFNFFLAQKETKKQTKKRNVRRTIMLSPSAKWCHSQSACSNDSLCHCLCLSPCSYSPLTLALTHPPSLDMRHTVGE